jgi:hypothetical protein
MEEHPLNLKFITEIQTIMQPAVASIMLTIRKAFTHGLKVRCFSGRPSDFFLNGMLGQGPMVATADGARQPTQRSKPESGASAWLNFV